MGALTRALALVAPLLVACAAVVPAPTASPPQDRPNQAATAAAIARHTATPRVIPTPPFVPGVPPPGATPVPTADPASLTGPVVFVRDEAVVVQEGGRRRTVFPSSGGNVKDPVFSPDGRAVAFAHAPAEPTPAGVTAFAVQPFVSDVMVVGTDGADPRVAVKHDAPGVILEMPAWSPDGKALYFSYYAPRYQGAAFVGEVVEVRRHDLATGVTTTVATEASTPGVAPDGLTIAYVGETPRGPTLRRAAWDGTDAVELVAPERFFSLLAPRFSPDGKTIAFAAAEVPPSVDPPRASGPLAALRRLLQPTPALAHSYPWEVWTVPAAGGGPRQLTFLSEDTPYPAWSRDASRLLVQGAGGLYFVDARTGGVQRLSSEGAHGGMDWRSGP